jgi:hypothetical protein
MFVDDNVRKCVVFLGTKEGGFFRPKATAFYISLQEHGVGFRYLVTAEHVVSNLQSRSYEIWVRSNRKDGTAREDYLGPAQWSMHPGSDGLRTDVALMSVDFASDEDFLTIPLSPPHGIAATRQRLYAHNVGVGHEIFITGLFRSHYGNQRNVPVVRVGNIAMMREEPVMTKYCGPTDAYLIEARSVGGLSGSPVFLHIPVFHAQGLDQEGKPRNDFVPYFGDKMYLLGLMHGHLQDVVVDDEAGSARGVHTGIGVVIPVDKIIETLNLPELVEKRDSDARDYLARTSGGVGTARNPGM